jgi:hypothetical protein
MATPKTQIDPKELEVFAWSYIQDCMNHKKEQPTPSGKVVLISDRKIPTISYFLQIWIPIQGSPTICRATYYNWLNSQDNDKLDTIKKIEGLFNALATDIVANEGKGIFFAKNKLGMSDRPTSIEELNTKIEPIEVVVRYDNRPQIMFSDNEGN